MSKKGAAGGEGKGTRGVRGSLRGLNLLRGIVALQNAPLASRWSSSSAGDVKLARTLGGLGNWLAAGLLVHEWHVVILGLLHHLLPSPSELVKLLFEAGVLHAGQGLEEGGRGRGVLQGWTLRLQSEAWTSSVDLKAGFTSMLAQIY